MSIKKDFANLLFWTHPLTGKRKPRVMFWVLLFLVVVMVVMAGMSIYWAIKPPYALAPTPTLPPPTDTPTATITPTVTPKPTATPIPVTAQDELLAEIRGCEKDPSKWTLEDHAHWGLWKVLAMPKCVLDDLGHAVAWYMAVREMGYTPKEAAEALGYDEMPWGVSRNRYAMYATNGKIWTAPLIRGFDLNQHQWKLFDDGDVGGLTYTIRGCFYTRHIKNNRVVYWRDAYNFPFDVECVIYEDFAPDWSVYEYQGNTIHVAEPDHERYPLIFAYDSNTGHFVFVGRVYDKKMWSRLDEINLESDYAAVEHIWGVSPWNLTWVEDTWGLTPQPVPENWQNTPEGAEAVHKYLGPASAATIRWMEENGTFEVPIPDSNK